MFNLQLLSQAVGQLRQDASYDAIMQSQQYVASFRSRVANLVTTLIQSDSLIKGQTNGPEDMKVSITDTCNELLTIREQYAKSLHDAEASKLACFIPLDPNEPESPSQAQAYYQVSGTYNGLQTWSIYGGRRLSSGIPFEALSFTFQHKTDDWIPKAQYYNPTSMTIADLQGSRSDWVSTKGFYFIYTVGSNRKLHRVNMITQGCKFGYSRTRNGLTSDPSLTWVDANGDVHFTSVFTFEQINNTNSSSCYLTAKTKAIVAITFTVDHLTNTLSGAKYWFYTVASDMWNDNNTFSALKADIPVSSMNRNCDSWNELSVSEVSPFIAIGSDQTECYINFSSVNSRQTFGRFLVNHFGNISTASNPEYMTNNSETSFQNVPLLQRITVPSASYALFTPNPGLDRQVMVSSAPDFLNVNNAVLSAMDEVVTILQNATYES